MTKQNSWEKIGFTENPFDITRRTDHENVHWAGMSTRKAHFERVFLEAQGSAPTQVILCHGPTSSGKTHTAVYFGLRTHWPTQQPTVRDAVVINVPMPKETKNTSRDFYLDMVEKLGIPSVGDALRAELTRFPAEEISRILRRTTQSQDIVKALLHLADPEADLLLIERYFLSRCTAAELRKLKLIRNLEKSSDYFRVLAGMIQCVIGFDETPAPPVHTRMCIWIDEMEDLAYFSPTQYRPFLQGLRELTDRLPRFLTLIMNFTVASPEDFKDIELVLGKFLVDRISHQIRFEELNETEKLDYIRGLLRQYATPEWERLAGQANTEYYPFSQDAVKALVKDMPHSTPRDVNRRCSSAVIQAIRTGKLDSTHGLVDTDLVAALDFATIDEDLS
jgi:hypothetical protein